MVVVKQWADGKRWPEAAATVRQSDRSGADGFSAWHGAWAWEDFSRASLGLGQAGRPRAGFNGAGPYCSSGLGPINSFQYSKDYPNINLIQLAKYEKGTSIAPNISKHCLAVEKFKRNNFSFGKDFIFPRQFKLKIREAIAIWK
jgi:hypothetical protein